MTFEVIVIDFSHVKRLWETRVKKYKQRCKVENQRLEKSALQKIKQEWTFMLECRNKGIPQSVYLKNGFVDTELKTLEKNERKSCIDQKDIALNGKKDSDELILQLYGEHWEHLPESLKEKTHLRELHVNKTRIQTIPEFIQVFQDMKILDLSQNKITYLPAEIGYLTNLKELNISFNNLKIIPAELGDCENLEILDLSGNLQLEELPFELSNLKKVTFIDLSANKFSSIPICVLRMSMLQQLDISGNNLKDLPQDIDRLDRLESLLLHKNQITYLPQELTNISSLRLLVISGDKLVEIPSALVENPLLKYVKILDSPIEGEINIEELNDLEESEQDRERFEKEFMKAYIEDIAERESAPVYTTKVSLNLQL